MQTKAMKFNPIVSLEVFLINTFYKKLFSNTYMKLSWACDLSLVCFFTYGARTTVERTYSKMKYEVPVHMKSSFVAMLINLI